MESQERDDSLPEGRSDRPERGDRLETSGWLGGGDWLDTFEDHLSENHLSDVGWFWED